MLDPVPGIGGLRSCAVPEPDRHPDSKAFRLAVRGAGEALMRAIEAQIATDLEAAFGDWACGPFGCVTSSVSRG